MKTTFMLACAIASLATRAFSQCDPFPYCLGNPGLHLQFCKPGVIYGETCVDVRAIAYGSVCNGSYAQDHASRLQSQYVGPEYHLKAWRCGEQWRNLDDNGDQGKPINFPDGFTDKR